MINCCRFLLASPWKKVRKELYVRNYNLKQFTIYFKYIRVTFEFFQFKVGHDIQRSYRQLAICTFSVWKLNIRPVQKYTAKMIMYLWFKIWFCNISNRRPLCWGVFSYTAQFTKASVELFPALPGTIPVERKKSLKLSMR